LHVGLGWRPTMQLRVGVDESEILALFLGEVHSQDRLSRSNVIPFGETTRGRLMNVRYIVALTSDERDELKGLMVGGIRQVRRTKRAQILLAADAGCSDEEIARTVGVGTSTVYRTKRRFVEEGVQRALSEDPRPGGKRKLSTNDEAMLVALACASPPNGRAKWTLELLSNELVQMTGHASISTETVRRRLVENELKPWQRKMWCIPKVDSDFVARMEDVLELYMESPDATRPVVCFDETPIQLIGEARTRTPPEPGKPAHWDYEYRRNGTANLFVFLDAHRSWRHVKVTERRTCVDFAECMRDLVDVHYPDAPKIRVVLDNLSAHSPGALYQAFPATEARRILRRIEFHFTPKHASWLNMVEIEIGVLSGQCLDRRIPDIKTLRKEISHWQRLRDASGAKVRWMFSIEKARAKLGRSYPQTQSTETSAAA
jgi:transposase